MSQSDATIVFVTDVGVVAGLNMVAGTGIVSNVGIVVFIGVIRPFQPVFQRFYSQDFKCFD